MLSHLIMAGVGIAARVLPQDGVCALAFCDDLDYWQLDERYLETCCALGYERTKEVVMGDMKDTAGLLQKDADLVFGQDRLGRLQQWLYYTMEDSESSKLAAAVSSISLGFVMISTVVMCLETVDSLQVLHCSSCFFSVLPLYLLLLLHLLQLLLLLLPLFLLLPQLLLQSFSPRVWMTKETRLITFCWNCWRLWPPSGSLRSIFYDWLVGDCCFSLFCSCSCFLPWARLG